MERSDEGVDGESHNRLEVKGKEMKNELKLN